MPNRPRRTMADAPLGHTPLGKAVPVPSRYDPSVLQPIDRAVARRGIGLDGALPFHGADLWRAYEFSWLLPGGKPVSAAATLRIDCTSPATVESKSLKLYLGSFAQEVFAEAEAVRKTVAADVAKVAGQAMDVEVGPTPPASGELPGFCLDGLPLETMDYHPNAALLRPLPTLGEDAVHSHLFRSLCPATGQPDWGSIAIVWRGRLLERAGLLAYLVSYRCAASFHEDAVERIFMDVQAAAQATELAVTGCFLRRGGIDINPYRAMGTGAVPNVRLVRQ